MVAGHDAHHLAGARAVVLREARSLLIVLLLLVSRVVLAADVVLRATVDPSLQVVTGTLEADPALGLGFVDALSRLPVPEDDLTARRTWPAVAEQGSVRLQPSPDQPGAWSFVSLIPRRYGAAGMVPGRGLFVNGLWHPAPMRGGEVPVLDWEVAITLPEGAVGALNGTVGYGELRWSGRADRLALAVIPGGHVTRVPLPVGEVVVLEDGPRRRRWEERLGKLFEEAWPGGGRGHAARHMRGEAAEGARPLGLRANQLVVVEAPLYRRLSRSGPGQLFLSDRALRLTDGLWRLHAAAVRRAMLESALPVEDPWSRALAAEIIAEDRRAEKDPRALLGAFAWLPQIDELLYDGNLPYYAELFDEPHGAEAVGDDLHELLSPAGPPGAAARKVHARYGHEVAAALAGALVEGATLMEAAEAAGVDEADLRAWRQPCPEQDLVLTVRGPGAGQDNYAVTVRREAPATAPPDLVLVKVDGEVLTWNAPPGPAEQSWAWPVRPRRVALDPEGLVDQRSLSGDAWPARWTAIVSAWVYELDLRSGRLAGFADVTFRKQYNTRWIFGLAAETSPRDLASASAYGLYYAGPLQDRRSRPLRLGVAVGPSLLDPSYRQTVGGAVVWDSSVWAVWETREDGLFPRRGYRLRASAGAGLSTGGLSWRSAGLGATGLLPLGGRLVLASRGSVALAESALPHRQVGIGLAGIAPGVALGDRQAGGELELRWHVVKNRGLPAGVAWLSDVQLSGGAEAAALNTADGPLWAAGWTAGLATSWDVFGARPTLMGVWMARPVAWEPQSLVTSGWPRAYLRFEQPF